MRCFLELIQTSENNYYHVLWIYSLAVFKASGKRNPDELGLLFPFA